MAFFAEQGRTYSIAVWRFDQDGPVRLELVRAGTVRLDVIAGPDGQQARIVYRASPGELNDAEFLFDRDPGPAWQPLRQGAAAPFALVVRSADSVSVGPGCRVSAPPVAIPECEIPDGVRVAGPVVDLGDGDDWASVGYRSAGAVVRGGPGNDAISAHGDISGGPGDDHIAWLNRFGPGSRITAGPGDDVIEGTKQRDTVAPGPGKDVIDLEGVTGLRNGGERIDTRDGEIDYLLCYRKDRADIDALDEYPDTCGHVRRHGGPARAIPAPNPFSIPRFSGNPEPKISLSCPADGPLQCSGTVTVSRRSAVFVRKRFRAWRPDRTLNGSAEVPFVAGPAKVRAMTGTVTVTVRSHDRAGRLRIASGTYNFPEDTYGSLP